jgi:hypothetical protein
MSQSGQHESLSFKTPMSATDWLQTDDEVVLAGIRSLLLFGKT